MQILYFAWLKERIGSGAEIVDPGDAETARELVDLLRARSEGHAAAFADVSAVRVAVDQQMGGLDQRIGGAREVAFFPPVTGG